MISTRARRRLITIPRTFLLFIVISLLFPLLILVALGIDVVRAAAQGTPFTTSRLVAFLWCYLASEVVGVIALFVVWLVAGWDTEKRRRRIVDWTYAVQRGWVACLFTFMKGLFGLRFEVEGDECAVPGPVLVFIVHASIADTLIPTVFITARHKMRLRFVLKRELLIDPCLDVAGNRLPNHFVARDSKESEAEIAAVRALTEGLRANEGVLIYPEGTRFTESKQKSALERLSSGDPQIYERALKLRHVLPPRLGGPLALLEGAPTADVIFVAHRGLEGFAMIDDVWRGRLVGRTVRVRMWRVSRSDIPALPEERIAWLYKEWTKVDKWIGESSDR